MNEQVIHDLKNPSILISPLLFESKTQVLRVLSSAHGAIGWNF
jgi:hypothetical protein